MSKIESSSQKQQLRLKIKKLKYKIQKEQKLQKQYQNSLNRLKRFDEEKLTIARVLKKISYLLQVKGLTMSDWLRAYPYDEQLEIERLLKMLQKLGVKLPRDEKGLVMNFIGDQFAGQELTVNEFKKFIVQNGLQMD